MTPDEIAEMRRRCYSTALTIGDASRDMQGDLFHALSTIETLKAEIQRQSDWLKEFQRHGIRCDLNPTTMENGEPVGGWHGYIATADRSVRERATQAVNGHPCPYTVWDKQAESV